MAKSKPGDPGQAGTYDPKKGGKFTPTTKVPPQSDPHDHGDDNPAKDRPRPK